MTLLVTGGAGALGSNIARDLYAVPETKCLVVAIFNALSYAGDIESQAAPQGVANVALGSQQKLTKYRRGYRGYRKFTCVRSAQHYRGHVGGKTFATTHPRTLQA